MALTVTNTNTISLLAILNRTSNEQSNTLKQLATGSKINSGADNPAGLIAVQSLSSELTGVNSAITNGQRAKSVLGVADGALTQVSDLLGQIQSLASQSTSSGGLSAAEISANQAQIDNAITSIDRIVRTTSFNGKNLLDGSQSIRATASTPSKVGDVRVYSRPSSTANSTLQVDVISAGAVASGQISTVNSTSLGAGSFSITGTLGTATITAGASDTLAQIRDKIIATAADTGVSASLTGTTISVQSRSYGTDAFVSASFISGDTNFTNIAYTKGTDAVVNVDGQAASVDGLRVSFNNGGTSGEFSLTASGNTVGSAGTLSVSGGGQTFQLGTASNTQATVGINSVFSQNLGDSVTGYLSTLKSGGTNSLTSNASNAVLIAKSASTQIATLQGRLGGFEKYQVDTALSSLSSTQQALTSARSTIQDVDFAQATADLNRQNVLVQSAISLIGVSGQQTSQILSLLR